VARAQHGREPSDLEGDEVHNGTHGFLQPGLVKIIWTSPM
jgi:hypothetical protein